MSLLAPFVGGDSGGGETAQRPRSGQTDRRTSEYSDQSTSEQEHTAVEEGITLRREVEVLVRRLELYTNLE